MSRFEELQTEDALDVRDHPSRNIPNATHHKWGDTSGPMAINVDGADNQYSKPGEQRMGDSNMSTIYDPKGNLNLKSRK